MAKPTLLIVTVIAFYACAPTKVLMIGDSYPAKQADTKIDIYRTKTPDREYIEIAELSCSDASDKYAMNEILKKTRELGGDAIIILGRAQSGTYGIPIGSVMYMDSSSYGLKAVSIKYAE